MYNKNQIQEKINEKFPNERIQVLTYTKMKEPFSFLCENCGEITTFSSAESVLYGSKFCCSCARKKKETLEVKHKIDYLLSKTDKIVIIPFAKISENMEFKCPHCGNNFKRMPRVFLKTQKCPYCETRVKLKPQNVFEADLKEKYGDEYKLVGEYKGSYEKTLIKHNYCGFIWGITPHNLLTGKGCPKCNRFSSKGEKAIQQFLEQRNFEYEREYCFTDSNISSLRFDFFLPQHRILIEFQGEQHFKPVDWFGGEDNLKKQQRRDRLKREFAQNNNYTLIEILYSELKEINFILAQRLSLAGLEPSGSKQKPSEKMMI